MDTSELYIKMANCPEIQKQWKPKEGDWVAFCGDVKVIADYEIWALEKRELSDIECWNEVVVSMGGHFVDHWNEARECFVFLPCQDQIQEMLKTNLLDLLNKFYKFVFDDLSWMFNKDHTIKFKTMEQLWLAFYMWEKRGKKWNGEEWVK